MKTQSERRALLGSECPSFFTSIDFTSRFASLRLCVKFLPLVRRSQFFSALA